MPERSEYRLSDMFEKYTERPELERIVTVYNINPGMNEELLESCRLLKEYMLFVTKVREKQKKMEFNDAVEQAVDDCISEGILRDFLWKNKAEAVAVSIYEFDEEKYREFIRREEHEIGREEGREEGLRVFICDKLEDGVPIERIVDKLVRHYGLKPEDAEERIEKCKKVAEYWREVSEL